MRKSLIKILLLLSVVYAADLNAQRAVLTGIVTNTKAKTVKTSCHGSLISYKRDEKEFPIDKKGNFKLVFDLKELELVTITIHEQYTQFYLQPGDSMNLTINYSDFDKSLNYSGKNSAKNMFLKAYNEKFIFGHEQDVYQRMLDSKAVEFSLYCDSMTAAQKKFLTSWTEPEKLDNSFITTFGEDLEYESASQKLSYPFMWAYLKRLPDSVPEMPFSYFSFVKSIPQKPKGAYISRSYFDYMKNVVDNASFYLGGQYSVNATVQQRIEMARIIISNDFVFKAYAANAVLGSLENEKFKTAEELYLSYKKANPASPYLEEVTELYAKIERLSPGKPAPVFTLKDEFGKERKLEEFKGKIVYLDFWASWCGPCVHELSYSKKLKEEYTGKDVVFLYVSIDEDEKSWREGMKKHSVSGVNLLAPSFDNKICESYNVTGIPAYFLVDRNGRIIDNNPPRPSDETGIRNTLNSALGN